MLGHLVLDQAHDRAGGADCRRDPEQVEVRLVARIVDARDHVAHAVAFARELADDDVVLVVAGRGDEQIRRPLDAGALEHEQLRRITSDHLVLELGLQLVEPVRPLLDERHLVSSTQQRTSEVRADLAATCDQHVHQTGASSALRTALTSVSIARRRRADDAHAPRRVELRARRIEDANDHRRHLELLLGRLGDHEVRVVAVGRDHDGVGLLDPRLAQELEVHAVPDEEPTGPLLAEPPERVLVLVADGDVPVRSLELQRHGRADAPTPDHDRLHRLRSVLCSTGYLTPPGGLPGGLARCGTTPGRWR